MAQTKSTSITIKILFFALGASILAGSVWYYASQFNQGVYDYEPTKDRSFVIDLFKNDWYWLISDYSSKNYSVEHMLDNRASSKDHIGNLILKTYRIHSKPVGFIAYFTEELFQGRILFVAIDKANRSKGYARKMVNYAIDDLKNRGMRLIRMITRTDNLAAQKLYKSMGFKQIWTDGAYLMLEKHLDS